MQHRLLVSLLLVQYNAILQTSIQSSLKNNTQLSPGLAELTAIRGLILLQGAQIGEGAEPPWPPHFNHWISQFYLHTHTFIHNHNEPCLCLPRLPAIAGTHLPTPEGWKAE